MRVTRYHHPVRTLLCCLLAFSLSAAGAQTLIIEHVTVIDTISGSLQPESMVQIKGDRIVGIAGPHAHQAQPSPADKPANAQVIDAHGQYLIPGLWDMHTHVYFDNTAEDGSDLILPLFVANGVTSIRDMGSELDQVLRARQAVAAHTLLGPHMIVSGPMLDGPKSPYKASIPIATPEDGRRAVDMLKSRGVDFIKVQSYVPREAYFAIADEAKKVGIPFEGHVPDAIRASEAVASGQLTFEHLIGIFEASSPDETQYLTGKKTVGMFLATYDPKREAAIIQLVAQHHIWQCPTLYWERGQWLVDAIDYRRDPDLAYAAHSWVTTLWPRSQKSILKSLDVNPLPVRERFVEHELEIVRKMHAAGIPFLAGTDTPAGVDVIPGVSLHRELERFVAAGFTPLEALQTATLNPAKFYDKLADYGTVHQRGIADLVLLKANPLEDIRNTRQIAGVIADGRYFSEQQLDEERSRLRALAATR